MASTPPENVIRWAKKLERSSDENLILSIIHKLSKVQVTVDLLQETGIGKVVRGLSKKPGEVGERALSVLHNWRKVVASAPTIPSPSRHEKHSSSKEKRTNPKNGHESKHPSIDKNNSSKHSHKSNKSSDNSRHFHSDASESRTKESSKTNSNGHLERKHKHDSFDDSQPKSKKQKLDILEKSSHSNTTHEKEKQNSHELSKDSNHKHGSKSHDSKKSKESKKSKDSEKKSSSVKKALGKMVESTDAFTSSEARFEDCLSFNDIVPVKRKKVPKLKESSKASSSNSKSRDEKVPVAKESKSKPSKHKSLEGTLHLANHSPKESKSKEVVHKKERSEQPPVLKVEKVDISSSLPQPLLNYKPLPQRNFDCFPVKKKALTNEDAILFTSSKKEKTAVYSGRRNFLTAVPTLQESCTRILIEHIDAIEYVGGLPYYILKPVLERCSPQQLLNIEDYNPDLLEDTRELWEIHCKKDFRTHKPQENETWRDLYLRAFEEREKRLQAITRNISASMTKSTTASRSVKLTYVDSYVKPPRDVARKQERNGTGLPVNHTMKAGPPSKASPRPTAPAINSAAVSNSKPDFVPRNAKPKVAPLMAKTLKSMKQCFRR